MGFNICVLAGMTDFKLASKLAPLVASELVSRITLIRRDPYVSDRVRCLCPPRLVRRSVVATDSWRFATLSRHALRERPDCILALGTVPHGVYAVLVGQTFRIPVIVHEMGGGDTGAANAWPWLDILSIRILRAAAAVAVRGSRTKCKLIDSGIARTKIFVQRNVMEIPAQLQLVDAEPEPEFDFVCAGDLLPVKGYEVLLDALGVVKRGNPSVRLLIVGDGPLRDALCARRERLGLVDNAEFSGRQPASQMADLLRTARTFVLASHSEGLPMVLREAMCAGLPAVVTNVGDVSDVAEHGVNALHVRPGSVAELAAAMNRVLCEEGLHTQLRQGALRSRERWRTELTASTQAQVWEDALDRVCSHADIVGREW